MFGQRDAPGVYAVQAAHEPVVRRKPMFAPGTVHYAAEQADLKELDRLIKEGKEEKGFPESVTLQEREDLMGMMTIHVAAERGHEEVVQYLINKRVDLDAGDKFRVTAMHLAAIENCLGVVKLLIAAKVNVKQPDTEGDLPLHWAATRGHVEVIRALVRAGSPLDTPNKLGWTPLHRAAYNGRRAACEALVGLGASLTACNKDGNTPLHLAAFMNQLATMETLLGLSARVDSENLQGQTPLQLCITEAAREIIAQHSTSSKYPKPASRAATPIDEGLAQDIERLSARPNDTALGQALRAKARVEEDFPDVGGHHAAEHADTSQDTSLFVRSSSVKGAPLAAFASEFLHEASQAFDDSANPYTRGYQNLGAGGDNTDRASRSSVSSLHTRTSLHRNNSSSIHRRDSAAAAAGERASPGGRAAGAPGSSSFHRTSSSHRQGAALAGRASVEPAGITSRSSAALVSSAAGGMVSGARGGAGALKAQLSASASATVWDGAERVSADEYQQKVREDNRKAAAAAGSVVLLSPGGGGGKGGEAAGTAGGRPTSANRKFLDKYQLGHFNLFAPS